MSTGQAERLITIHDLDHPRSVTRRINACLTLASAAAVGILALTAIRPAANVDTDTADIFDIGTAAPF